MSSRGQSTELPAAFLASLRESDVLCGRAKQIFVNPGNRTFRELVQQRREAYRGTDRRSEKRAITQGVIQMVRENSGRFLKLDEASGAWFELTDEQVYEKVSHALRGSQSPRASRKKSKATSRSTVESRAAPRVETVAFQAISECQQRIFQLLLQDKPESRPSSRGEGDSDSWSFGVYSVTQTDDVDGSVYDGNDNGDSDGGNDDRRRSEDDDNDSDLTDQLLEMFIGQGR